MLSPPKAQVSQHILKPVNHTQIQAKDSVGAPNPKGKLVIGNCRMKWLQTTQKKKLPGNYYRQ